MRVFSISPNPSDTYVVLAQTEPQAREFFNRLVDPGVFGRDLNVRDLGPATEGFITAL